MKMCAFLVSVTCLFGAVACGDDGNDDVGDGDSLTYPRQADIEYRLTSPSGLSRANVFYTNESGGMASADGTALPFSTKFTRTVKQYDSLSVSVAATAAGSLDLAIVVDDAVVDMKTYSGTTVVSGTSLYIFQ